MVLRPFVSLAEGSLCFRCSFSSNKRVWLVGAWMMQQAFPSREIRSARCTIPSLRQQRFCQPRTMMPNCRWAERSPARSSPCPPGAQPWPLPIPCSAPPHQPQHHAAPTLQSPTPHLALHRIHHPPPTATDTARGISLPPRGSAEPIEPSAHEAAGADGSWHNMHSPVGTQRHC